MPPKKKKTAAKSRSRKPAPYPKALIVILVLLLIAGISAVKYLQTPKGRVALLDAGFFGYYAQVQEQLDEAMRGGLDEFGLKKNISEKAAFAKVGGNTVRYLTWSIRCGEEADFVLINVALTKGVHDAGGRVRHSEETDNGSKLLFVVGSGKYDTHRLELVKAPRTAAEPARKRPMLALVIDDLGYSRNGVVNGILDLDLPLTISVLPGLSYSTYALRRAHEKGKCTILHLPMEPEEKHRSDLDEVKTDMDDLEIRRMVERYVRSLPGIKGVNNHQGSRATADRRVMEAVLGVLKEHGLFFLDSLTSNKSIAYNTAVDLGVPAARNYAFLDDETQDPETVAENLRRLVAVAKKQGTAVGIGHPRRWTLEALEASEAYLKNAGVDLVFLTDVVK